MKKFLFILTVLGVIGLPVFGQTGFQMLEVDGLQVNIDEVRFVQGYSNSTTIGSIEIGQTVNLTENLSDVFNESTSVRLEFGVDELAFDVINIQLSGGVGIKGHTYFPASDTHVYTSTAGIKKLTGAGSTWSAPADYGYHTSSFFYHPGDAGETQETTFLQTMTTYTSAAPLEVSLLVDTYQVAYYWDGEESSRHGFVKTMPYENPSYFPTGTEVIGITYLPLYVAVNQNLSSETYVVAESTADLTPVFSNFYNEKRTMNMTLIFDDDDGSFFIGRTANWDGLEISWKLSQFVRSAVSSGTNYNLSLSSYSDGSGWSDTETINGFTRLQVGDAAGTASYTDSDGASRTLNYVRVK